MYINLFKRGSYLKETFINFLTEDKHKNKYKYQQTLNSVHYFKVKNLFKTSFKLLIENNREKYMY